jgi:hypothetical protein
MFAANTGAAKRAATPENRSSRQFLKPLANGATQK